MLRSARNANRYSSPYRYQNWVGLHGRSVVRGVLGFGVLGAGIVAGWSYVHPFVAGEARTAQTDTMPAVARSTPANTSTVDKSSVGAAPQSAGPASGPGIETGSLPTAAATTSAAAARSFSPNSPHFATAAGSGSESGSGQGSVAKDSAAKDSGTQAWPTVVDTAPPRAVPTPVPAIRPAPGDDARRELARSIQKELKRVGCYEGETHGYWNTATTRAMGAFISRSNASLPVDKPDVVHLALLKGETQSACGATAGKPIMAAASPPPGAAAASSTATIGAAIAAGKKAPLPGAMAVGGPVSEPAANASGAEDEVSPSLTNPQAAMAAGTQAKATAKRQSPPAAAAAAARKARPDAPPSARHAGARSHTRAVQDIFQHPLGR